MAVLAAPAVGLVAVALAAAEVVLLVGSAALVGYGIYRMTRSRVSDRVEPRVIEDCPPARTPCPPCVPPVGTVAFEIHRVPPSRPDWPCLADHVHWFLRQQNPNNCQCFWMRNFRPVTCLPQGGQPTLQPGEITLP
jgi:hypothetical protein